MDAPSAELWILVLAAAIGTYAWRVLGILFSGRIEAESELFNWVACVAYAMVAGLIARILVMPTGLLATSLLVERLVAIALGMGAFYATRKNLFVGVIVGMIAVVAAGYVRHLVAFV